MTKRERNLQKSNGKNGGDINAISKRRKKLREQIKRRNSQIWR